MSLNFFDNLMDKFALRESGGNSILKSWTGSQNFVGNHVSFNDSILYKYQEALLEANDSSSTNFSNKRSPLEMTIFPLQYNVLPNTLVSRVSKLFFPSVLTFQDYSHKAQEISTNNKLSVNKVNNSEKYLWEELMQVTFNLAINMGKHHSNNCDHLKNSKAPGQFIEASDILDTIASICTNSVNMVPAMVGDCSIGSPPSQQNKNLCKPELTVEVLATSSIQEKGKTESDPDINMVTISNNSASSKTKKLNADNGTLNKELANRKTKEMQKRSKNRRRRQKKSDKNMKKASSNINDRNPRPQKLCEAESGGILKNEKQKCSITNSATLCNVINITDKAKNVQIILPNVSSFLITVDSAGEDSDWDENSDSEWLNDTSEFELSGLNMCNLTYSKPSASLLSVPSSQHEDAEALQLNRLLHRVNKEWNEATKDLDGKSRSSAKVSFVPDDELVEVLPVEIYERKGEWEMYALERIRFKRRIDELDKILSPYLTNEHREKILKKCHIDL